MERKASQDALLWGLVGCGGILFLVLLAACGFGMYLVGTRGLPRLSSPGGRPGTVAPDEPPVDGPFGQPGDPPPARDVPPPLPPGTPPKPPPPLDDVRLRVSVTSITGSLAGRVMTSCDVLVSPPAQVGAMCKAMVTCDGVAVYGDERHGFFQCVIGPGRVVGSDANTTASDGDAAFVLDTDARVFRVRDDAQSPLGEYAIEGLP